MKKAFTLIELLIVVALIAIISTLAVTKLGNVRETSARKVSLANQVQIGRSVDSYMTLNNGRIDRLDSLLDDEVAVQGGNGFYDSTGSSLSRTGAGFYLGPDDAGFPLPEAVADADSGLTPNLVNNVFVPYSLSKAEVNALANRGFRYVMRHTTYANTDPRTAYGNKGDDGAYLTDDKTVGLDPVRSACIPRAITNGMVVAAISPFTPAGRAIYRDCGMQLLATHETAAEYRASENEVKAEVAAQGGALLAFGLGAEASIIGDIRGGLDVEPICTYPNKKFYNRYILLFRVRTTTNAGLLEFVGVIDPCGNIVRAAREAIATL